MKRIKNGQGETVKAGCVVFDESGKLLVVTPKDRKTWGLPKGHAEVGERAEQVAVRETYEETGYEVRIIRQLDDLIYKHPKRNEHIRVHLFLAEAGKQTGKPEENYKWMTADEAKSLLYPNIIKHLDEFYSA